MATGSERYAEPESSKEAGLSPAESQTGLVHIPLLKPNCFASLLSKCFRRVRRMASFTKKLMKTAPQIYSTFAVSIDALAKNLTGIDQTTMAAEVRG